MAQLAGGEGTRQEEEQVIISISKAFSRKQKQKKAPLALIRIRPLALGRLDSCCFDFDLDRKQTNSTEANQPAYAATYEFIRFII